MCIQQHKIIRVNLHGVKTTVDYCKGGTTPRTTIGSGSHPSRTGSLGKRVGAIDIRCPPSPLTRNSVGSQVTPIIGYMEEDTTSTAPQPLRTQSTTTPIKNTQQVQVGDHIYIKNKISHLDRPNAADRASVVTDIAHYPKQQVFLTTYSGVETWRSPLNLRHLSSEEKIRLRKQQDE